MKRVTALIAALAVPAILLVGCGGDDSADSGSKSDSSSQSSDSGSSDSGSSDSGSSSSTGNAKVDKFCDDAKALAEKSKKAIADRDTDLAQEAAKDAQALSQQAQGRPGQHGTGLELPDPLDHRPGGADQGGHRGQAGDDPGWP